MMNELMPIYDASPTHSNEQSLINHETDNTKNATKTEFDSKLIVDE